MSPLFSSWAVLQFFGSAAKSQANGWDRCTWSLFLHSLLLWQQHSCPLFNFNSYLKGKKSDTSLDAAGVSTCPLSLWEVTTLTLWISLTCQNVQPIQKMDFSTYSSILSRPDIFGPYSPSDLVAPYLVAVRSPSWRPACLWVGGHFLVISMGGQFFPSSLAGLCLFWESSGARDLHILNPSLWMNPSPAPLCTWSLCDSRSYRLRQK